jgi:hypothetical protein
MPLKMKYIAPLQLKKKDGEETRINGFQGIKGYN